MEYHKNILLKDGRSGILRNGTGKDGQEALDCFILTHGQTDYLLTYPEENTITALEEGQYLMTKTQNPYEVEILAEVDGKIVGLAGIDAVGEKVKIRHRAEFGISIDKAYWGLGIGRALLEACMDCAQKAGYEQVELNVVAENERAVKMYHQAGFVEYGRNPRGFKSRNKGYQEVIFMRKELK